jgi:hypothetical protein
MTVSVTILQKKDGLSYHTSESPTRRCPQRKLERHNNRSKQVAESNNDTMGVDSATDLTDLEPRADALLVEAMVANSCQIQTYHQLSYCRSFTSLSDVILYKMQCQRDH